MGRPRCNVVHSRTRVPAQTHHVSPAPRCFINPTPIICYTTRTRLKPRCHFSSPPHAKNVHPTTSSTGQAANSRG
jgi:hypothetical protein